MDFETKLESYSEAVEKRLEFYMEHIGEKSIVSDAMKYSLMNGGKRVRPVLVAAFADMVSDGTARSDIDTLKYACAVEMVHTYSLIHDDLPCMDNDDFRRGKLSCHKKFGEEYALLAGDGLLNLAFETLLGKYGSFDAKIALKAGAILSTAAGTQGMIGGQTLDLLSEGKSIDLKELEKLHSLKTGAMITASCRIGALVGGGSAADDEAATKFGDDIGLCFQIVDDILDTTSTTEKLGKPVGSDVQNNKSTYVSLMGLDKAREKAAELTEHAFSQLEIYGEKASFLRALAVKLSKREM